MRTLYLASTFVTVDTDTARTPQRFIPPAVIVHSIERNKGNLHFSYICIYGREIKTYKPVDKDEHF